MSETLRTLLQGWNGLTLAYLLVLDMSVLMLVCGTMTAMSPRTPRHPR